MKNVFCFLLIITSFSNVICGTEPVINSDDDSFEAHLANMQIDKKKYKIPEIVLGSKNAKYTMVLYSSFSCDHCRKFHLKELRPFIKKYVDTGKVRLMLRYYIDDIASFEASAFVVHLSNSNDKIAYKLMETIFDQQNAWRTSTDQPKFLRDLLARKMQELYPKSFEYYRQQEELCLDISTETGKTVGARVMLGQKEADRMGILSIPCMIFNGTFDKYRCITNAACHNRLPEDKSENISNGYCYQGNLSAETMWKIVSGEMKKMKLGK